MKPEQERLLLLGDALDRIALNPTASHCWINLMALLREQVPAELQKQVVRTLRTSVPDEGLSGFYLATFLDILTGDWGAAAKAVGFLQVITPRDPDRLVAYYHIAWQRALLYSHDRPAFTEALSSTRLPALAALIDDSLSSRVKLKGRDRPIAGLRKVALIAPQLTKPTHPPTRMVLDQAQILAQNNIAVNLFSSQETAGPDFAHLLGTGASNPLEPVQLAQWASSVGTDIKIHGCDQRFSVWRRWHDLLGAIEAYDPDLVMFVGLHSGLIGTLYATYPILGLGINSIAPMVPCDVWLTAQAALDGTISRPWGETGPESQAWYHPYRVRRKATGAGFSRASLGIDDQAVVIVSVGSHFEERIVGAWAERMCEVMARHPALVWLMPGGTGALPAALNAVPRERLHLLAHTPLAMDMIAASDIYVTPPIMGGGFAVAEAMSCGLPVLAFADSDGGDKLGAAAMTDIDGYFERLEALIADSALRQTTGNAMRIRFDEALDLERSGPSLLGACALAQERFRQRTQGGRAL